MKFSYILAVLLTIVFAVKASAQQIHLNTTGISSLIVEPYQNQLFFVQSNSSCPGGGEFSVPCRIRSATTGTEGTTNSYPFYTNRTGSDATSMFSNITSNLRDIFWLGWNAVYRKNRWSGDPENIASRSPAGSFVGSGNIAADPDYVYWIENTSSAGAIYRVPVGGGPKQEMYRDTNQLRQLKADGSGGIFFINNFLEILHHVEPRSGGFSDTLGPPLVQTYSFDVSHVYGITISGGTRLRRLFRANLDNISSFTAGTTVALDSESPNFDSFVIDDTNFYYLKETATTGFIFRLAKNQWASGVPESITGLRTGMVNLNLTEDNLFWEEGGNDIYRHGLATATVIQADAGIANIEVTQGMQRPDNSIDLVENKLTTVRVFPSLNSLSGLTTATVSITVHGFTDSGAPLSPASLPAQSLTMGAGTAARNDFNASANFRLPPGWLQNSIRIRADIRISGLHDSDPANNSLLVTGLTFRPKTHVCVKFLPILTRSGQTYQVRSLASGAYTPGFLDTVRRFETLWPVPQLKFFTQNTTLKKPQFLGQNRPFNMTDNADSGHLIAALWEHNVWDNAPDWCGGQNARTHYVAMLHPSIDTTTPATGGGMSTRLGTGSFGEPFSWVKMTTNGGFTLAHELTHNYNNLVGNDEDYQHVNCGLPMGADFNNIYPYDPCTIGLSGGSIVPTAGWGYDYLSDTIFEPGNARDYMSYAGPPWSSDYRWEIYLNKIEDKPSPASKSFVESLVVETTDVISLFGLIAGNEQNGEIVSAIYAPPGLPIPETNSGSHGLHAPAGDFTLNLLDKDGNVLSSTPVLPTRTEEEIPGTGNFHFYTTVPYFTGTQTLEIMRNGSEVVTSHTVSAAPPEVTVQAPTLGTLIDSSLTVEWTVSDPDSDLMEFSVQYRENDAAHWRTLESGLTGNSFTLPEISNLPGGSDARVRVIASDGFNVGIAQSDYFELDDQPPQPAILLPRHDALYPANQPVTLEGRSFDPEFGDVNEKDISWTLTGPTHLAASGSNMTLHDLPPGSYALQLTAIDAAGNSASASGSFTVATKSVLNSNTPILDGRCRDDTYANDHEPIHLRTGTTPAIARFIHADGHLYVCVENLPFQSPIGSNTVLLSFDVNNSDESTPQSGDFSIQFWDKGQLETKSGNGGLFTTDPIIQGGFGLSSPQSDSTWSVEFRIEDSRLGEFSHLMGMHIQFENTVVGFRSAWPFNSSPEQPATWGTIAYGPQSQSISFTQPGQQIVGDEPFVVQTSASSGLPVILTSTTKDACQVTEGHFVITVGAGTCSLTVEQPGNESYNAADPEEISFDVIAPIVTDGDLALGFVGKLGNRFSAPLTFGWSFETSESIEVTALGFFDSFNLDGPGLQQQHRVRLWTDIGELMAETTITNASDQTILTVENGRWLFNNITPVLLSPGTYVIGADDPSCISACDEIRFLANTNVKAPLRFLEPHSGNIGFPLTRSDSRRDGYFGPNFRFHSGSSGGIPGDFDFDGNVDFTDLFTFEGWFFSGDSRADFDNDGDVDFGDLFIFEGYWNDANS